ncbi:MAG: biopolymer transporter ExbD [Rhizobiaceae bacterium]|nr:biopolymer transporter ExbD [Rhizobiaceae bacterium]
MVVLLPRPREARQRENTIALINIVLLMLIFFLIAGTLTPPLDKDVELISTVVAAPAEPPEALFITAEGDIRWQGRSTTVSDFLAGRRASSEEPVRIAADRSLLADKLIDILGELRAQGAERVVVVTERTTN